MPILDQALEKANYRIQEIVLTHGHPDHIGDVRSIHERYGLCAASKMPWPDVDSRYDFEMIPLEDACVIETEGATLHGIHAPWPRKSAGT